MCEKAKTVKMKANHLFAASDETMESLGTDKEKVQQDALRGLQSILAKHPKPFNCRRCGTRFQPKPRQWIFYKLCDSCFDEFDAQKMHSRIETLLNTRKIAYFEDVDAWIAAFPYSPTL
jgi:hypothetical protein